MLSTVCTWPICLEGVVSDLKSRSNRQLLVIQNVFFRYWHSIWDWKSYEGITNFVIVCVQFHNCSLSFSVEAFTIRIHYKMNELLTPTKRTTIHHTILLSRPFNIIFNLSYPLPYHKKTNIGFWEEACHLYLYYKRFPLKQTNQKRP